MDRGLAEFQVKNCKDCKFADKPMVGSGEACCQKGGRLDHRNGDCYSWRADEVLDAKVQGIRSKFARLSK